MKRKTVEFEPITIGGEVADRGINVLVRQGQGEYVALPAYLLPEGIQPGDRIRISIAVAVARQENENADAASQSAQPQ